MRCRPRLLAAALASVAALGLLAGCTVSTAGHGTRLPSTPSASPSTSAAPIAFSDCTSLVNPTSQGVPSARASHLTYQCGRISVPADYANPAAGTVQLYVLKVHDEQATGTTPLFVDPGGPGGSAVSLAVGLSGRLSDDILAKFDVVGVDPRGVGLSSPVTCLTDAQKDEVFSEAPDVRTPEGVAQADDIAATWVKGCEQAAGSTLGGFTTVATAHDFDTVRQSLGATSFDYLGYSYGTLLGAVYAHLFPATVGRMVLDGAIDPGLSFAQGAETQAAGFEAAFGQFAADCATRSACAALGDAGAAVGQLAATATASGGIPSSDTADPRKATAAIVYSAVASALYDQSEWPALGSALVSARQGDGKGLLQLSDEYYQRDSSGSYTNLIDAFTVVSCNDGGVTYSDAELTAFGNDWATKYPVFGAYFAGQMAMCNGWPASADRVPSSVPATGSAPIVVVGTTHDPATPYANTQALATSLGVGTVVSWDGQGHTAYLKSECVDTAVDAYLLAGTVPTANTLCPA